MTLEDFFTLTEMKDGLTAASRVEELVTVMQKEKDGIVNPGDAIRQWAAVAGIIAATDNKDCLDLFVQLGGLRFIDRWLKDAENFGSNNGDNFVEESITALLLALEKLCIDKERSISSGVWVTVEHLLDNHNVKVQDRARAVFDNWNHGGSDNVRQQRENSAPVNDGALVSGDVGREIGEAECSPRCSPCQEKEDAESRASEAMRVDNLPLHCSSATEPGRPEDVQTKDDQNQPRPSSALPEHDQEGISDDVKGAEICPVKEKTKVETCGPDVPDCSSSDKADAVPVDAFPVDKKPVDKLNSDEENLSRTGATDASEKANVSSDAGGLTSEEIAAVSSTGTKADVDEGNLSTGADTVSDHRESAAEPQIEMAEVPKAVDDNGFGSDAANHSPNEEPVSEKLDDIDNSLLSKEVGTGAKSKDTVRDRYKEVSNLSALYRGRKGHKRSKKGRGKKSTFELEYGILDALDIARQVAKEVEREVTDYKQPFYSTSSDKSSGGPIEQPRSPDSINDSIGDTSSDESTGQSQSAEGGERRSTRSGHGGSETKDPMEDVVESSHLSEAKAKMEKGFCQFDLNEDFCSDDGGNKVLSNEGLHDDSSQKQKGLEIDLNMAEDGEETSIFPETENHIPVSSKVNSKGSSVEANQGRWERLNLDLNSTGDDDNDVVISDSHHFNGRSCPSPASSSSQMQPHERNFDLNDWPSSSSVNDPFSDAALYHNPPTRGAISLGKPTFDPFISIMGTKVEINKDDVVPQRSPYLHNGKATLGPSSGGFLGLNPAVSSLYSPLGRCSALPAGHTIQFSLAPYGPSERTHCAVDPRIASMLPRAAGPTPALYSPYPVQFPMSLNAGPSRPQLDLNSGFSVDGASRDPGFVMQLFPPSQVQSTGEHSGSFLQPFSGSIVGAKRKEPEGGWEPYPVAYGQHQFPWK